jgi:hypothetical protein
MNELKQLIDLAIAFATIGVIWLFFYFSTKLLNRTQQISTADSSAKEIEITLKEIKDLLAQINQNLAGKSN